MPYLGEERRWQFGRHDLDARDALLFVLTKLREKLPGKALFHLAPNYWSAEQAAILDDLTRTLGYRLLGTMRRGLVGAGMTPGLTIDVDSFAVTLTLTKGMLIGGRRSTLRKVYETPPMMTRPSRPMSTVRGRTTANRVSCMCGEFSYLQGL